MRVILASASPRRRDLLARIAYPFEVRPADVDESRREGEDPESYAQRLAAAKARRISVEAPDAWTLGADTIVVMDGEVIGKPRDPRDAAAMLERLAGRTHRVVSAIAWARGGEVAAEAATVSEVRFRPIAGAEIERHVAGAEPWDKAGGYALQGEASSFVRAVTGSVTGVIGLPLEETGALARRLGVPAPEGPLPVEAIALRMRAVAAEVAARAVAAGRPAASVRVVAVGKRHPPAALRAAVSAGARDLGENYVQEAAAKRAELERGGAVGLRWHLIGPLQRNKAALAASSFDLVHTIAKAETARALVRRAAGPARVLVQVNAARDRAKAGVSPEALGALAAELRQIPGLRVEGLMTIGRLGAASEEARSGFAELRALLDELRRAGFEEADQLSMGMSADYDAAIAEGATLVRLGTAIFGPRPERPAHPGGGRESGRGEGP